MTGDRPESGEAWKERLRRLEEAAKPTFWGYLGCEAETAADGKAVIRLRTQPHHLNLMGIVHGGVLASLLDNAMGLAVMSLCPDENAVTAQMNVHFLQSSRGGLLLCEAGLVHRSRRTLTLEGRVLDSGGELLAWGSGSFRRVT
ncbi:PaaI family thioesterase [Paenibacillus humicola]|uniref:PaaI family thioesterase n=1 Tax=Paenibacillus humicola TaxID=3110540 RepID=UPI00237B39F5|nr:PaaI family thioesterase [Paenibacillus humicola]